MNLWIVYSPDNIDDPAIIKGIYTTEHEAQRVYDTWNTDDKAMKVVESDSTLDLMLLGEL